MQRIHTLPTPFDAKIENRPDSRDGRSESFELSASTEIAVTRALRRVGGEGWQHGMQTGQRIDPKRMAFHRFPDARPFSTVIAAPTGEPRTGIFCLIDSSGSMAASCCANGKIFDRRTAARAMAVGFARAARRAGLGFTAAHHGTGTALSYHSHMQMTANERDTYGLRVDVHRTTETLLKGPDYGDNWDAFAVWHCLNHLAMPAKQTLFVLLCDGEPTICPSKHSKIADACIRRLEAAGHRFAIAYIGSSSQESLDCCVRDWGASRVIDCTRDLSQLTLGIIRAMRSIG